MMFKEKLMKRSWIRRLATLVVGLGCIAAFTTMNLGCACKNGPCGHGCNKPCCKKPCDKPCDKKEEPKKDEPKKP